MKEQLISMQVGKNGLTENFMHTLENTFKTHTTVKIVVLKSGRHSRENVRTMSEKILSVLGKNYTVKIVGFTIFVKKWRKEQR